MSNQDEIALSLSDDEADVAPDTAAAAPLASRASQDDSTSPGTQVVDNDDEGDNDNDNDDNQDDDAEARAMRAAMGFAAFGTSSSATTTTTTAQQKQKRKRASSLSVVDVAPAGAGSQRGTAANSTPLGRSVGKQQLAEDATKKTETHVIRGSNAHTTRPQDGGHRSNQGFFKSSFIEDPWQGLTPRKFSDIDMLRR